ncbi:hypothetical protein FB561_3801 [Kribbella amoyensis]|uniref:Uncharacterized protein n=1 Tax=Kribbella amoyensis TaxID=996641 RepID=A0A561BUU3_9ACTN|nr:hypothetical protein [Kribbella amoyensis]TWD82665.1 hypothetical protein FB561_3801 [Kribbella amoyensis]
MRAIAQMVAVAGMAVTAVAGSTMAAHAQEARVQEAPATVAAGTQSSGEYWCGNNYNKCDSERYTYLHYGFQVSPIYYREGQTCPGGASCADGYYFYWWS